MIKKLLYALILATVIVQASESSVEESQPNNDIHKRNIIRALVFSSLENLQDFLIPFIDHKKESQEILKTVIHNTCNKGFDQLLQRYQGEDNYVYFENFFSPERLDSLAEAIKPIKIENQDLCFTTIMHLVHAHYKSEEISKNELNFNSPETLAFSLSQKLEDMAEKSKGQEIQKENPFHTAYVRLNVRYREIKSRK